MREIYLFENPNNDASVVFDSRTLTEEQKQEAVVREALPVPEQVAGKISILKVRKATDEVWYDHIDEPKQPEIEKLKQEILDLKLAMAELAEGVL